jgi:type IX secretion system PorP/SprF family membrane protein
MKLVSIFTSCLLLSIVSVCGGQNYPLYNAVYANPFLYNPATAANEETTLFIHHRQQWVGVQGAPVISAFSINSLIENRRYGLGVKVSSFQRGLLSTSDVSFAYAYGIPLNKTSQLYFGMSVGAITNTLDISSATDPNDPAFANYQDNNLQASGSFGVLYKSNNGLSFGLALPQLFAPSFLNQSFATFTPQPFDQAIASLGYRRKLEGKLATKKIRGMKTRVKGKEMVAPLEFYVLYRYAAYQESQFEIASKLNLTQSFWLGASYRQNYGIIGSAGFRMNRLSLGYFYELGSQPEAGFSQGSHEVFASLRLGEIKKFKRPAPVLRSTLVTAKTTQHHARFQNEADDPEKLLNAAAPPESKKVYYVVVRSFGEFPAADVYKNKLIAEKYNADIYYSPKDRKYHVHIYNTSKSSEAYEEVRNLKSYTKLKDARVLVVETETKK